VVVGSSRHEVVVLDDAVLRVWSRRSERDWSGGARQLSGGGYGRGQSGEVAKEEEKGAPRWGVAPFIAARGSGRRRRGGGNRWAGKRRQRHRGRGKAVAAAV
jgi:hypothetical protein